MAFTAGSVELARANRLGNQLAHLFSVHGLSGAIGVTGAKTIEKYAKKAGFGITGITTGNGFPPFGSFSGAQTGYAGIEAALQNPRGETMAAGITLGNIEGQTVGIYLKKFVRNGADYKATVAFGVTLATSMLQAAGTSFTARGPVSVVTNDRLNFGDAVYIVVGSTSAAVGGTASISVRGTIASTYATGAAFNVETIGVTRGTFGVYGSTFENYASGTAVHNGFTANIYFNSPSGGSGTWTVS